MQLLLWGYLKSTSNFVHSFKVDKNSLSKEVKLNKLKRKKYSLTSYMPCLFVLIYF